MNNKGQSLLEVIVALAIFALISATMVALSTGGFITLDVGGQQTQAQVMAQEGVEGVRAIRDRAWNELIYTSSSVSTSSGQWVFNGEGTTNQSGNYIRTISILPVCRDVNNNIAVCPASYIDVQTKKVISEVDWPVRNTTNTIQQVSYLTNWDTNLWTQTDWAGGSGQNIWSVATKYLSDDCINASTTGQLQLKYNQGSGCGPMIWDFNNQYQYTYDQTKIEVVGGLGQLKDLGSCSGVTSTCLGFSNQTSCQAQVGCSWTPSYTDMIPNIRNFNSYSPNQISYWSGFAEIANKNGGEIYYQLSNDDGVSWKYWDGSIWATSTLATDYNTSTIISANIGTFTTSTKKIMFKAFLSSNGTQQVKLDQVQIDCSRTNDWDFSIPASYSYNTSTIRVTSSLAQLVNLNGGGFCSGTATACNTFGNQTACTNQGGCSWQVGGSGATTNPNFTTTLSPWARGSWGKAPTMSRSTTGGHPTGYAKIQFPNTKSVTSGGYFQQKFTTTKAASIATLNLDWIVTQYTGAAQNLTLYAFVDKVAGAPTIGGVGQVWSSGNRTSTSGWAGSGSINIAGKITGAGTYYLKIAAFVKYTSGGVNRSYAVGFDNVQLNWTYPNICSGTPKACNILGTSSSCLTQGGCSWNSGTSYATTSPGISPTVFLSVPTTTFSKWTHFIETANKNGGQIFYQLSNNSGSNWQYWNGSAWATAGAGNYNTATVINTNIPSFSTSTGKLMFKAFLTSNGVQLVQLDNVQVWWQETTGVSNYATLGSVISSAFNLSDSSPVSVIFWRQNTSACTNCAVKLQVRTAPNNAGVPGTWSAWYGPSGAGDYFTDYHGQIIPQALNWNQWVQYQAWLSGDGNSTPILNEVTVYYK